jgi:hypothetical protein
LPATFSLKVSETASTQIALELTIPVRVGPGALTLAVWKPRAAPTRSIDTLVRERTSVAVRAALKELIEVSGSSGSKAKARRSSS